MLSIGCDRETACKYLGFTFSQLRNELHDDPEFETQMYRAEATPEFNHMRNLNQAAKDEKHWRASVWWMERMSPERFARRAPNAVTMVQLKTFIEELADLIIAEIPDEDQRMRLLERLSQMTDSLEKDGDFQQTSAENSDAADQEDSGNELQHELETS